ncbi:hypothetical protein BC834DRAFT_858323 [Gloeopeniophorella convolvens]|nr:hypothetical protein BC834DRAFT_858323 [Gloeopeniophorella convolvens]
MSVRAEQLAIRWLNGPPMRANALLARLHPYTQIHPDEEGAGCLIDSVESMMPRLLHAVISDDLEGWCCQAHLCTRVLDLIKIELDKALLGGALRKLAETALYHLEINPKDQVCRETFSFVRQDCLTPMPTRPHPGVEARDCSYHTERVVVPLCFCGSAVCSSHDTQVARASHEPVPTTSHGPTSDDPRHASNLPGATVIDIFSGTHVSESPRFLPVPIHARLPGDHSEYARTGVGPSTGGGSTTPLRGPVGANHTMQPSRGVRPSLRVALLRPNPQPSGGMPVKSIRLARTPICTPFCAAPQEFVVPADDAWHGSQTLKELYYDVTPPPFETVFPEGIAELTSTGPQGAFVVEPPQARNSLEPLSPEATLSGDTTRGDLHASSNSVGALPPQDAAQTGIERPKRPPFQRTNAVRPLYLMQGNLFQRRARLQHIARPRSTGRS